MRQQYHSKKVDGELFIWEVHKLISKSTSLRIFEVELSEIRELGENYWYLCVKDVPTCKSIADHMKLVLDSDLNHPIILAADGSLMDGMHRVCKAYLNEHRSIKAVKFELTPEPDHKNVPLDQLPYD